MFTLTLESGGTKTLLLSLNTLRTLDFTAFHEQAADYMKKSVRLNYFSQSAPDGTPWPEHGPPYLSWLAARGGTAGGVLQLRSRMRDSLDTSSGPRQGRVFYKSVGYNDRLHGRGITTDLLALYHTGGTLKKESLFRYAPRPQMGFSTTRGDVAELTAMLRRVVNQAVAQASAAA